MGGWSVRRSETRYSRDWPRMARAGPRSRGSTIAPARRARMSTPTMSWRAVTSIPAGRWTGGPSAARSAHRPIRAAPGAGGGGVFVTWQDPRNINYDIYLQHVLATGDVDPGWPLDGRAVCTAPAAHQVPAILADGSGGAIVTWFDGRPGATNDIYAQRVQSNGQLGGTVVGVPRDGRSTLPLDPGLPNPWRGGVLTLSFTLPTGSPATLDVIDVAGRRAAGQAFGSPGPGRQSVRLRPGAHVAPGIYLVQLRQGAVTSPRRLVALE